MELSPALDLKNNVYYQEAPATVKPIYEALAAQLTDTQTYQNKVLRFGFSRQNAQTSSNKPLFEALTPKVLSTPPNVMEINGQYLLKQDDLLEDNGVFYRYGDFCNVAPFDFKFWSEQPECPMPDDYTAPNPPKAYLSTENLVITIGELDDKFSTVALSQSTHYKRNRDRLFGFAIPFFQRGNDKWTLHQKQMLIDSVMRGLTFGAIMATTAFYLPRDAAAQAGLEGAWSHKNSLMLVDGQQRLTAFAQFLNDEFPVYNRYFSQFTEGQQKQFLDAPINLVLLDVTAWHTYALLDLYDRLNYGGTVHDAAESAYKAEHEALVSAFSMSDVQTYHDDTVVTE